MTLERIKQHILEQAQGEARGLVETARQESESRLSEARAQEKDRLEEQVKDLEAELERERQQTTANVRTRARAEMLRMKTEILETVFSEAKAKILAGAAYRTWLKNKLDEVTVQAGEILCRPEDRAVIGELLKETGREGLKVAESGEGPAGGFVVRTEKYDLDVTLDAELAGLREDLVGELVEALSKRPG